MASQAAVSTHVASDPPCRYVTGFGRADGNVARLEPQDRPLALIVSAGEPKAFVQRSGAAADRGPGIGHSCRLSGDDFRPWEC